MIVCVLLFAGTAETDHAQVPGGEGEKLPLELAWRVEVLFRSKAVLPPAAEVHIGPRTPSEISGYDKVAITYTAQGETSQPILFLLSRDGKSLVQFNKFDISEDPRTVISGNNRPSRGGPATAPVSIIVFDDLECPFCARLNAMLFPAILDRYKDQVRVVYMDFPIPEHPWALRAAVDTSCLAKQSNEAYWDAVDTIHSRAAELGGTEKSLAKADDSLDRIVGHAGDRQHVDAAALKVCIAKQDASPIELSRRQGELLNIQATPTFFINGARIEGVVPIDFIFHMIDSALLAEGETPPSSTISVH